MPEFYLARQGTLGWMEHCMLAKRRGMRLRSLHDIADSFSFKLVWRFLEQKSIQARWMLHKYYGRYNFWNLQEDMNASAT